MKRIILLVLVCSIFSANLLFSQENFQGISGINVDNYPRVDGSSSTDPLNTLIACRLLGWDCQWQPYLIGNGIWLMMPNFEGIPENFFDERVKSSQTHNSIINLIDNQVDIIVSARKMSADERAYAESKGVSLIETPIALDALVFLLNKQNPVNSLTIKQVQDIYTGNITNWNELGGADETIKPFIRNENSGSQEMMKEIVMNNAGVPNWDVGDDEIISTMAAVYTELAMYQNGICFSPHYYKEYIIRDAVGADNVKSIEINGIYPDANTIKDKTYPFLADVYVSIRSDLDQNSMAYKLYEWLQTPSGKSVIEESGYIPSESGLNNINQINDQPIQISLNSAEGTIGIRGIDDYKNQNYAVYNMLGQLIQSGKLKQTIDLPSEKGLHILTITQNRKVIAREKIIVK